GRRRDGHGALATAQEGRGSRRRARRERAGALPERALLAGCCLRPTMPRERGLFFAVAAPGQAVLLEQTAQVPALQVGDASRLRAIAARALDQLLQISAGERVDHELLLLRIGARRIHQRRQGFVDERANGRVALWEFPNRSPGIDGVAQLTHVARKRP